MESASSQINDASGAQQSPLYGIQFYPYTTPGVDPIFAVTGDREEDAMLNSCAWSQDLETGDPLICVAGRSPKIKILNVKTGQLVKTLIGHGQDITDLVVSPLTPAIIASASYDHSIRLWTLDAFYDRNPCVLICAGEGHKDRAFHHSGRYLLSGGMDCIINLWALPELPDENAGTDKTTLLHYPHFSTAAVHSQVVDCVQFYNDFILSKATLEHKIVLWKIDGFSSHNAYPSRGCAPSTHEFKDTRSAFGGSYQRLLQFEVPNIELFYMRFSFFNMPFKHPVLAIGNVECKVYFWDFQRFEEWTGDEKEAPWLSRKGKRPPGSFRGGSASTTASSAQTGSNDGQSSQNMAISGSPGRAPGAEKYSISDPFFDIAPHLSITVPKVRFAARQAAWSVDGEWMVVVGDNGMIAVFHR
ncbi:MAG: hypothetical protein M1835_004301 [Candelina submexicana]|nr:MAG: hypothetical protein M1835_004301 [Candelina submexicana]